MSKLRRFNNKLQSRIHELGYNNYDAAGACDMHEADFSRVMHYRRELTFKQMVRLCEFLKSLPMELGLHEENG